MARPSSTDRLVRLLALPAWVAEHPGASLEQAAAHFGVSTAQVRRDVETLWVAGLPDGMPDALVDFDADALEAGRLHLTQPLGLDRPVTLTREEGVSLLLSLRVLTPLLDTDDAAAAPLHRAAHALLTVLGGHAPGAGPTADRAPAEPAPAQPAPVAVRTQVLQAVRRALAEGRRLHLSYVSATEERSERDVDPFEVVSDGSHLSLHAWCTRARAERTFRLDRVLEATVSDERAPVHRRLRDQGLGRLASGAEAATATLHLAPAGRWLVEQPGCEQVEEHGDGRVTVRVHGRSPEWLVTLVLSAGDHVLDVEPAEVRDEAACRARAALARYEEPGR